MFYVRRVVGHSMLPILPPGTLVIGIESSKAKPGKVVIIEHDGKEKIKRIEKIEDNKIFVVGDHGADSSDSRQFGWLDKKAILAKIIWPRTKKPKH